MLWVASFHSSTSNVWSLCYLQKFFLSSVRTAKCFCYKSHPSSCTSFTFCFCWLLWTAGSWFLTLLLLAEGYMDILVAGSCQWPGSYALTVCAQTLSNHLFFPLLENTGMQVHWKSNFDPKAALQHNGSKPAHWYTIHAGLQLQAALKTAFQWLIHWGKGICNARRTTHCHIRWKVNSVPGCVIWLIWLYSTDLQLFNWHQWFFFPQLPGL